MPRHGQWTNRCILAGSLLSLTLGVIGTYGAYLQEARFQYTDADNPWLMGIAINSVLAAVFILPISAVIGRAVQRTIDNRQPKSDSPIADNPNDTE